MAITGVSRVRVIQDDLTVHVIANVGRELRVFSGIGSSVLAARAFSTVRPRWVAALIGVANIRVLRRGAVRDRRPHPGDRIRHRLAPRCAASPTPLSFGSNAAG